MHLKPSQGYLKGLIAHEESYATRNCAILVFADECREAAELVHRYSILLHQRAVLAAPKPSSALITESIHQDCDNTGSIENMKIVMIICAFATGLAVALPAITDEPALEKRKGCDFPAYRELMFSSNMSTFQAAKRARNPSCWTWTDDGCSHAPDELPLTNYDFKPACQRHDFGYRNGKKLNRFNDALKREVDDQLKEDLYKVCAKYTGLSSFNGVACRRVADVYVAAVRRIGKRDVDELMAKENMV